ncbi:hypothetical protein F4819DRAFT_506573 [Hypoxylon fuscum]|nr:hypothetical protein F4819DRAFT_506573 [Hypoxylon fuscum]
MASLGIHSPACLASPEASQHLHVASTRPVAHTAEHKLNHLHLPSSFATPTPPTNKQTTHTHTQPHTTTEATMCWPYDLIYSCRACLAEGRPRGACSVVVRHGAADPVAGGCNREGWLCPLRFLGPAPAPAPKPLRPLDCPCLRGVAPTTLRPVHSTCTDNGSDRAAANTCCGAGAGDDRVRACSWPPSRYWACPAHRLRRDGVRRRRAYDEARRRAAAREDFKAPQKRGRWREVFEGVTNAQPRKRQKREMMGGESKLASGSRDAEAVVIASAALSLLDAADLQRALEQRRARYPKALVEDCEEDRDRMLART